MRLPRLFLIFITVFSFISSCALNKLFLVPGKLNDDSSYKRYVEDYNDTLKLTFAEDKSPVIVDSKQQLVDLPYNIQSIFFENRNNDKINAWFMTPRVAYNGTTLYFLHGNAGNIAYQFGLATPFVERGYQVFMIDYSGFGFSEGKATRKHVLTDANDGLDYLINHSEIEYEKLLIYGQSLGGHLAAVVASRNQDIIDGVIIEGAFSSHSSIANEHVPILGYIFTREMYSAKKSIPTFQKPVLIIHSTEDETIPYEHGIELFEAATTPKSLYTIDQRHIRGPLYYPDSIVARMESMISQ